MGYIVKPRNDVSKFKPTWVLMLFDATTVIQIIRNGWGSGTLETLVRNLVQHGIQFNTLVPTTEAVPDNIIDFNRAPESFSHLPPNKAGSYDSEDYTRYVQTRNAIMGSHHSQAAFQMGGIIWRLAMQSLGNLNDIVNALLDGLLDLGPTRGEYFVFNGGRYYDYIIPPQIVDTICGTYGLPGCAFLEIPY